MLQYRQKHRCTVHCHKQAIIVHTHIHRNCFPVVALGKLKLHYGPPEGSGERGIEEEEKRERKRGGGGVASVMVLLSYDHHEDITVRQKNRDHVCTLSSYFLLPILFLLKMYLTS